MPEGDITPQPQTPAAEQKKKINWKVISIIAVVAVIVIAVAGYTVYTLGLFNKPAKENSKIDTNTAAPSPAKSLLEGLSSELVKVIPSDISYKNDGVQPKNSCRSWKSEDGNFITLKGYEFSISADKTSPNMEKFANVIRKISNTTVNSYFIDKGFIESDLNSSLDDFDFRHCGQPSPEKGSAFSKNDIYCVGWLYSIGESRISFFCGEQDKEMDNKRKEFEDVVYNSLGKSMYFTIEKTLDNYALIGVYPGDLVLRKENNGWIKVGEVSYMEPPLCDYIDSRNIPRKLFDECL